MSLFDELEKEAASNVEIRNFSFHLNKKPYTVQMVNPVPFNVMCMGSSNFFETMWAAVCHNVTVDGKPFIPAGSHEHFKALIDVRLVSALYQEMTRPKGMDPKDWADAFTRRIDVWMRAWGMDETANVLMNIAGEQA